jgi:hypothetical protein
MWDYYAHTKVAEVVLKLNGVHADENMPLLFANAITKDKYSRRKRRHRGQKPQSRKQPPNVSRRPRANPHQAAPRLPPFANDLVGEGLNEPSNSR